MRMRIFMFALALVTSCSTGPAIYDADNKSMDPILLTTAKSVPETFLLFKRTLALHGFLIGDLDSAAGVLMTFPKALTDSERVDMPLLAQAAIGARTSDQAAMLRFVVLEQADSSLIQMSLLLTFNIQVSRNAFREDTHTEATPVFQGHPLYLRILRSLLQRPEVDVYSPKRYSRGGVYWQTEKGMANPKIPSRPVRK